MACERLKPAGAALRPSFPRTGAALRAARVCESVVFGRRFGNSSVELAAEYGPYEPSMSFGAVLFPDGIAVAAIRLIRNGSEGLKWLNDAAAQPWRLSVRETCRAADLGPARTRGVGSFGVDSRMAGSSHRATPALWSVLFGAFRDNHVASFVAILDLGARRPIGALGVQMLDLPGVVPATYLGSSANICVHRQVGDLHRAHLARIFDVHQQVYHGRGFQGLHGRTCQPGAVALDAA